MTAKTLRDDQTSAIERLKDSIADALWKQKQWALANPNAAAVPVTELGIRVVMQAPTGYGKTILASGIVAQAVAKKKKVLFTVPAIDLIDQTCEVLFNQGIHDIGVIQSQHAMTDWSKPVQVASVQSLMRRDIPEADLVLIDECHRWFKFYETWLHNPAWYKVPFIGLSATPWTKGLGAHFTTAFIEADTTEGLIKKGLLSDFKVFAPTSPDLTGVRTVAGDYHEAELAVAMNKSPLVADIIETWKAKGEGRPTLVFAVDRAHAKNIEERFNACGVKTGYQDAFTKPADRRELKRQFHNGEIKIVCSVGTMTVGIDWDVRCIVWARPTKSEILFVQGTGRGLRTAPGKDHCLILDHSDNHLRLGFVTDIRKDKLDTGRHREASEERGIALPKKCPNCTFLKPPRMALCPACGHVIEIKTKIVEDAGELTELDRDAALASKAAKKFPDKRSSYAQLMFYAASKSYNPGWAGNKYRDLYGVWPRGHKDVVPVQPSYEMMKWIRSTQIRWAKSKRNPSLTPPPARDPNLPKGALSDREQKLIESVRERFAPGMFATEEELADFR